MRIVGTGRFLKNDSDHNFRNLAEEYLDAANVLNREYKNAPKWTTYFNAFRSLESYLKSYLLRRGKALRYVERTIGHKLKLALDESKKLGLVLTVKPEVEKAVIELSEVYTSKDFQYRSIGGWQVVPPDLVIAFVKSVAKDVGARL